MALERLQKILARAGISSRRHAEQMILAGRVRVNGRIVSQLGARADAQRDKVELDGQLAIAEQPAYVLLHKPRAVVSTANDPEGRPTVTELVTGLNARLYPVGRLDFQTSGALLLTNDGEFAAAMLHPSKKVPKRYLVKLQGEMADTDVKRWSAGVVLDDGHKTLPAQVKVVRIEDAKTWLEVVLHEGRNQQIRRMGQATNFEVLRLTRLSFAGISIDGLRAGGWRLLTLDELRALREEFGVPKRIRPAVTQQPEAPARSASRTQQARRGGMPNTHARVRDPHPEVQDESPRAGRGQRPPSRSHDRDEQGAAKAPRDRDQRPNKAQAPRDRDQRPNKAQAPRDRDQRPNKAQAPRDRDQRPNKAQAPRDRDQRPNKAQAPRDRDQRPNKAQAPRSRDQGPAPRPRGKGSAPTGGGNRSKDRPPKATDTARRPAKPTSARGRNRRP